MGLFLFTLTAVGVFLIVLLPVNYVLGQIVVREPSSVFRRRARRDVGQIAGLGFSDRFGSSAQGTTHTVAVGSPQLFAMPQPTQTSSGAVRFQVAA